MQKKIIYINVINEHSVLARISGLFAGRGYNIDSLTVAPLPDRELSRITISTRGDKRVLEQIIKQLYKLVPVLNVSESDELVAYELLLVKFDINENIDKISAFINALDGKVASVNERFIIFSIVSEQSKTGGIVNSLNSFSPREIIRSGAVAIDR